MGGEIMVIKSYNLSKEAIKYIEKRAKQDDRSDSKALDKLILHEKYRILQGIE